MVDLKGFLYGLCSSTTFGLIPFFALPLMQQGMLFDSVLFYRFLIAGLLVGVILFVRREPFHATYRELGILAMLSGFYTAAALLVFMGLSYLPSGVVTTIHFLYPVFVALIMMLFFNEKRSPITITAILLATAGVALLSSGGDAGGINLVGLVIVLFSALFNALYIVGMCRCGLRMTGLKVTFYLLMFGSLYALLLLLVRNDFQRLDGWIMLLHVVLLALVTAVISNLTLVIAVRRIGSTLTSILGAMEPVTAVAVGVLLFHETLTTSLALGVLIILLAVGLIILARPVEERLARLFKR
ncbi:MAG: DMT family transporter [Bilophila sp.]